MLAGGLWHVLGVFQYVMKNSASLLMFTLSAWLIYEYQAFYKHKNLERKSLRRFYIWIISIFVFSIIIENIGVVTGLIFGTYVYGDVLFPFIFNVPVAIGFAWINVQLSALSLFYLIFKNKNAFLKALPVALITALLMTAFDYLMEPAAMALNYWNWENGEVPFLNYMAWFILSFIFTYSGLKSKALSFPVPIIPVHAYFAQLAYFIVVTLK